MASCIPHPHLTCSRVKNLRYGQVPTWMTPGFSLKYYFKYFLTHFMLILVLGYLFSSILATIPSDDMIFNRSESMILWSERTQLLDTDPCLIHLVLWKPGWVRHRSSSHWASIAVGAVGLRSTWQVLNGYDIRSLLKRKVECHLGWYTLNGI